MQPEREDDESPKALDDHLETLKARQRNTLWPDALQNAKSVDGLLLNGSARPSSVQRIGMLMFAVAIGGMGCVLFTQGFVGGSIEVIFVSLAAILLGLVILRNAVARSQKHSK